MRSHQILELAGAASEAGSGVWGQCWWRVLSDGIGARGVGGPESCRAVVLLVRATPYVMIFTGSAT